MKMVKEKNKNLVLIETFNVRTPFHHDLEYINTTIFEGLAV